MTRALGGAVIGVVGASGGLGAPISRRLAERGARVVLAGRDPAKLARVGVSDATTVSLDLRSADAGPRLLAAALDAHGRLDGVVNAAGVVAFGPLAELDEVVLEELFLTNVVGPLLLVRALIPELSRRGGFVANLSAVVAEAPLPGMVAYSATKAALTAADRALARELRRVGIHVVDLRPPHTETGLAGRALDGVAPGLPVGLDPAVVACRVVRAIEDDEAEVPAAGFGV